jgi:hypothetical protein
MNGLLLVQGAQDDDDLGLVDLLAQVFLQRLAFHAAGRRVGRRAVLVVEIDRTFEVLEYSKIRLVGRVEVAHEEPDRVALRHGSRPSPGSCA